MYSTNIFVQQTLELGLKLRLRNKTTISVLYNIRVYNWVWRRLLCRFFKALIIVAVTPFFVWPKIL